MTTAKPFFGTSTPAVVGPDRHQDGPQPGTFNLTPEGHRVELYSRAWLPTRSGEFTIFAFRNTLDDKEHIALVKGDVWGHDAVPMRIHSECLTGDVFTSLRCDCREQLERAQDSIGAMERGFILYMRQEGRGIGLGNKIRAYALQEQGMDTVEANLHLGFDDDMRRYDVAVEMIKLLQLRSIVLMTNNPNKLRALTEGGIEVVERRPIQIKPNPHNRLYLRTKRAKSGHHLELL